MSRPLRILYHHRVASGDGQYVHISELIAALRREGHEVLVVEPDIGSRTSMGSESGLVSRLKARLPAALYELMELAYAVIAFFKLRSALRRYSPDCLYERYSLYLPSGVWLHKRYGIPMLLEVNAPLLEERSRFDGLALASLGRWCQRYIWRGANVVLPVTDVLAGYVRRTGIPEDRITVIHNGIELEQYARVTEAACRNDDSSSNLVIGFVGFMRDWHGLDQVVEYVARAGRPGLKVLFVGEGPARAGLEALAAERGISDSVEFVGSVGREDIPRYLAQFDIALQPAVVEYASPLKLFEYMGAGCAIIAPDSANIREILTDGHDALLFDTEAPAGFGDCLDRLVTHTDLRREIGRAARQTIRDRDFTWDGNARRVAGLARQLLDGGEGADA